MDLTKYFIPVGSVAESDDVCKVVDLLCANPEWPFVVVLDDENRPLGVVRDFDLKNCAFYGLGKEMIKHCSLDNLIMPTMVLPWDISGDDLLSTVGKNPNPDGVVMTHNGVYYSVLLTREILRLSEESRLETQARLAVAQKMEAISTLAGGIAHDLNNILTPIQGYTELIRHIVINKGSIDLKYLDEMQIAIRRAVENVGKILAFSRHKPGGREKIHLGDIAEEVLQVIRKSLPGSVATEINLETLMDTVWANELEMHQIILNLCANAAYAVRDIPGRLVITLARHKGPLMGWSIFSGTSYSGEILRLTVSDNGAGIDPEILPRIFEPFFTTKEQGEGTGIGLALVHGLVSRNRGMISVETRKGIGTSFHIYLPVYMDHFMSKASTDMEKYPVKRAAIKALFVDDEFSITRMAKAVLPKYGIDVECENDSCQANILIEKRIKDFDVLITDQVMPTFSGMDLARHALELRPAMPVIICTGYSDSVSPDDAMQIGVKACLMKPPDYNKMARLIHGWIDQKRESASVGVS